MPSSQRLHEDDEKQQGKTWKKQAKQTQLTQLQAVRRVPRRVERLLLHRCLRLCRLRVQEWAFKRYVPSRNSSSIQYEQDATRAPAKASRSYTE